MIMVHHLNNSRSQRVLWLLEELGIPYTIRKYERDPRTMLAPPALTEVHPLGKSPVITDGDITVADSNVHAGAKYMDQLMTKFFPDAKFDEMNRTLFAFAAYNAGPGRIQQLRRLAAKRGLDPNVWFRNVEYVAAEKIGQETVTYVSNIFKYYVAYRLILESRAATQQAIEKMKGGAK